MSRAFCASWKVSCCEYCTNTMMDKLTRILSEHLLECKLFATLGCLLVASIYGLRWRKRECIHRKMEKERKRRETSVQSMKQAVEKFHKLNPGVDSGAILSLTFQELTEKLQNGSLSPETVLYSYAKKALEVDCNVNCVTVFLSDCEAQLKGLREKEGKGPLYGVPISIKEHVGYQGHPSTCGFVQYLSEVEEEDSIIVKVLKKQGAIVFAKTNVPQSLLCCETSNPIYRITVNPYNRAKGVSGSSGGEGALIGGGGSILGIGTDLGGSIRLPASVCGIAGFKPTSSRQSLGGVRPCIDGMTAVSLCSGPMGRDVNTLVIFMRALWCDELFRLDPYVTPLHFNEEIYSSTKPLRIGYYEEDGYFKPNPGMRRVLLETKHLLEDAGHKLILFNPPRVGYAYELFWKALLADKGETVADKFKNNIMDPNLEESARLKNMSNVVKRILCFVLQPIYPRISSAINSSLGARSVKHLWKEQIAIQEYQTEFLTEWRKLNLDVILCPMLGPAFNVGYPGKLFAPLSCTMLYNLLNYPAGVIPVGSVTAEDEEELKHYRGYSNDPWDKLYKKAVEGGLGLPLSVQCVALPHQDELCLRLMKEIETLSNRHQKRR
ncbi:vitamin D3 hydroxylase-associated protein-like isoform X2 [Pseudophryne corroboree]|uniref:vitamin D3 hydroxylase-associated protein-like isoform X2 n=1 Tax=Pseudophryne corroboree TaxID=495146 RepID=UPI0030815FEC